MFYPHIAGAGYHVPPRVVTNEDLRAYYDTSDAWIRERSGIQERRFATEGQGPVDLAVPAVEQALAEAGLEARDVDMIVFATLSPEYYFPGSGCLLQRRLPFRQIPALDIRMQCSGFIYALSIAEMYIKQGVYRHVLVVGAEVQSTSINFEPEGRAVGVIFGDGAGAFVLSAGTEPRGILSSHLHTDGNYAEELTIQEPTSLVHGKFGKLPHGIWPHMNGREVYKHAVRHMSEAIQEGLRQQGWTAGQLDCVVPHQANLRIGMAIAEDLGVPFEKFFMNIQRYGNTTAASIPIAFCEAVQAGRIRRGDRVMLVAFGSGFTWGSAALIY
ncbi:MAG: ketoacyl-ACP synthase III [Bacteroidetes bacterium]|jgi:3-oxoacyl-[acyl-carrier-protein] synthase-3|nr:ketoacyl-ACP synthase III [Bacteroidota bacterium]